VDVVYTENWFFQHSYQFKLWFNPNTFDWDRSYCLAIYCSSYFTDWWDSDKFDWGHDEYLAEFCFDHFKVWWDSDKFDWRGIGSTRLVNDCFDHFHIWWDADKFDWDCSGLLADQHNDCYKSWWNPDRFNWDYSFSLIMNCWDYKNIWLKDKRGREALLEDKKVVEDFFEELRGHGCLPIIKV